MESKDKGWDILLKRKKTITEKEAREIEKAIETFEKEDS